MTGQTFQSTADTILKRAGILVDNLLPTMNSVQEDIASTISTYVREDYFLDILVFSTEDTTNDYTLRRFSLPPGFIKISSVSYRPNSDVQFELVPEDVSQDVPIIDEQQIINRYTNGIYYSLRGDYMWLLSGSHIPTQNNSLQIQYIKYPIDFASKDLDGNFPLEEATGLPRQAHEALLWGVIANIAIGEQRTNRNNTTNIILQKAEQKKQEMILNLNNRNRNRSVPIVQPTINIYED